MGYRQRIKDSPLLLYAFTYVGAAYTGDFTGVTLMDSIAVVERSAIVTIPTGHFCEPPRGNELCLVDIDYARTTEADTVLTPRPTVTTEVAGTRFRVTEYEQTYGSASFDTGLMRYEFDDLTESADSLTLHGVSRIFGGHELTSTVTFPKGNIWVEDPTDHSIRSILVECVVVKRGRIYKPTDPFVVVSDRPIVGVVTYEFFPRVHMLSSSLSDYGLWKPVRSWPTGD